MKYLLQEFWNSFKTLSYNYIFNSLYFTNIIHPLCFCYLTYMICLHSLTPLLCFRMFYWYYACNIYFHDYEILLKPLLMNKITPLDNWWRISKIWWAQRLFTIALSKKTLLMPCSRVISLCMPWFFIVAGRKISLIQSSVIFSLICQITCDVKRL